MNKHIRPFPKQVYNVLLTVIIAITALVTVLAVSRRRKTKAETKPNNIEGKR